MTVSQSDASMSSCDEFVAMETSGDGPNMVVIENRKMWRKLKTVRRGSYMSGFSQSGGSLKRSYDF